MGGVGRALLGGVGWIRQDGVWWGRVRQQALDWGRAGWGQHRAGRGGVGRGGAGPRGKERGGVEQARWGGWEWARKGQTSPGDVWHVSGVEPVNFSPRTALNLGRSFSPPPLLHGSRLRGTPGVKPFSH